MFLSQLQVTIEPYEYVPMGYNTTLLKVTVKVNGKEFGYRREIQPDHLNSLFDVIFEEAKTKIKEAILQEKELVKG